MALLVCIESASFSPECTHFVVGKWPENGLDGLPWFVLDRILANLEVHSVFMLMEAAQIGSPIYVRAERALKHSLMPTSGDINWFDTPDAAHALQDLTKIRQFLEYVGALYPTFFKSLKIFNAGDDPHRQAQIRVYAEDAPRMWDFLSRLSRIPDVQYDAVRFFSDFSPIIRHFGSHIRTMEDVFAHSIWPKFDGPIGSYSDLNILYAWLPNHKVRSEHRRDVFNALDWFAIRARFWHPKIDQTSQYALRAPDPLRIQDNEYVFLTPAYKQNGLPSSWLIEHKPSS